MIDCFAILILRHEMPVLLLLCAATRDRSGATNSFILFRDHLRSPQCARLAIDGEEPATSGLEYSLQFPYEHLCISVSESECHSNSSSAKNADRRPVKYEFQPIVISR